MSFNELTDMANGVVPNFRRMSKKELAIVLGHPDEAVREQVVEYVRTRTIQRYGSSSTTQRNEVIAPQPEPVAEQTTVGTPGLVEDTTYFNREEIQYLNTRQLAELVKVLS